jgi:hypothetical protein
MGCADLAAKTMRVVAKCMLYFDVLVVISGFSDRDEILGGKRLTPFNLFKMSVLRRG